MGEFDDGMQDEVPSLVRENEDLQKAVAELKAQVEELRARPTGGVATLEVRAYIAAVDSYLASGSANAMSAWKALRAAKEKLEKIMQGEPSR